jgi:hypothetical protein
MSACQSTGNEDALEASSGDTKKLIDEQRLDRTQGEVAASSKGIPRIAVVTAGGMPEQLVLLTRWRANCAPLAGWLVGEGVVHVLGSQVVIFLLVQILKSALRGDKPPGNVGPADPAYNVNRQSTHT